jgi:hypothetical protein
MMDLLLVMPAVAASLRTLLGQARYRRTHLHLH